MSVRMYGCTYFEQALARLSLGLRVSIRVVQDDLLYECTLIRRDVLTIRDVRSDLDVRMSECTAPVRSRKFGELKATGFVAPSNSNRSTCTSVRMYGEAR